MEIKRIISQMTLEEKALMLTGAANMKTADIERLGIKSIYMADGPHGVRAKEQNNCTSFPCLSMVGSTWNKELIYEMGVAIADDCIKNGKNTILGPGINIKRTPLCGRNFEYISEDPVLSGEIAASYIKGVQSMGVGTCLKHFAMNNQEKYRLSSSSEADIRTMREIYLKGFEIAVKKADPYSVMCAYNKVNSVYCSENKYLLTDVLKDEWGYGGCVISDWGAVHDICRSIAAGLDLEMPKNSNIFNQIKEGLEKGCLTETDIDKALYRVLAFVFKNKPLKNREYNRDRQHEIASKVASEGVVLLKNDRCVLPITSQKYKKIAVIGGFAEHPLIQGQGSAEVYPQKEYITSPLQKLKERLGDEVEVKYLPIFDSSTFPNKMIWPYVDEWTKFVSDCDAVIIFAGAMSSEDTEQFDRRSIELNPNYLFVIKSIAAANKNVVTVIQSGSAMALDDVKSDVSGIVQMWLAGEAAGDAIADVLTGKTNPSGKLSETFPKYIRKDTEYPGDGLKVRYNEGLDVGYRYYDSHPDEICYPFGYGLSYTTFDFSDFNTVKTDTEVRITLKVRNSGDYDGSEVLQLYVGKEHSCVSRPPKELKAFEKIKLKKGNSSSLTVTVKIEDLGYFNVCLNKWIVEPGIYRFMLGTSSRDLIFSENVLIDTDIPYTVSSASEAMIG